MACTTNIIGYRGCTNSAKFYLDDYGISVNSASKITDDKFTNAKDMLDKLIAQSWVETFADITFDGMQANKILNDITFGYMDESSHFTGTRQVDWVLDPYCELGSFYASQIKVYVKTGGATTVNLIQGGVPSELYNNTPADGDTIEININDFVSDSFSLQIITAGEIYTGIGNWECRCEMPHYTYTNTEGTSPFIFTFQVRCNKDKHLCKYVDLIAPAVINKIMGKVWFKVHTTDIFSNYVNSESDKAIAMMVYYDNQYRSIIDSTVENKALGQYQISLNRLNIPKPTCKCCMECKTDGWAYIQHKP